MKWSKSKLAIFIAAIVTIATVAFGADNVILNPVPDQDTVIKVNDGGVIKDLLKADADIAKIIVDGDFEVTGASTGVTAASAAPDWLTATAYGLNEIVVDPNSGIIYRANNAHTSAGTNLTDNAGDYDVIGSASSGVVVGAVETFTPSYGSYSGTIHSASNVGTIQRIGDSAHITIHSYFTAAGSAGQESLDLPTYGGLTITAVAGTYAAGMSANNGAEEWAVYVDGDGSSAMSLQRQNGTIQGTHMGAAANILEFALSMIIPIAEWENEGVTVPLTDLTEETDWIDHVALGTTTNSWEIDKDGNTTDLEVRYRGLKDTNGEYHLEVFMTWIPSGSTNSGSAGIWFDVQTLGMSVGTPDANRGWTLYGTQSSIEISASFRTSGSNTNIFMSTVEDGNWGSGGEAFFSGLIPLASKPSFFDANRVNPAAVSAFVPEATSTTAGLVKKNKIESKVLTGGNPTSTGVIAGISFTGMTIGNMYRVTWQLKANAITTGGHRVRVVLEYTGGTDITDALDYSSPSSDSTLLALNSGSFIIESASQTGIQFNITNIDSGEIATATAQLEELHDTEVTTDF